MVREEGAEMTSSTGRGGASDVRPRCPQESASCEGSSLAGGSVSSSPRSLSVPRGGRAPSLARPVLAGLIAAAVSVSGITGVGEATLGGLLPKPDEVYLDRTWEDWCSWNLSFAEFGVLAYQSKMESGTVETIFWMPEWRFGIGFGEGRTRCSLAAALGKTQAWTGSQQASDEAYGEVQALIQTYLAMGDIAPYLSLLSAAARVSPYPMQPDATYSFQLSLGVPFGIQIRLQDGLVRFDGTVSRLLTGTLRFPSSQGGFQLQLSEIVASQVSLALEIHLAGHSVWDRGISAVVLTARALAESVENASAKMMTANTDASLTAMIGRHVGFGAGVVALLESAEAQGERESILTALAKVFLTYRSLTPNATVQLGVQRPLPKAELEGMSIWGIFGSIRVEIPR